MGNFSRCFYKFLIHNRFLLLSTTFIVVVCYGFEITNYTMSIDEELAFNSGDQITAWLQQGRLGIGLIKFLFFRQWGYIPYFSTLVSVCILALSALVWCFLFSCFFEKRLSTFVYVVFVGFYLSVPAINASFISFDTYNVEISIGMLSLAMSIYFIYDKVSDKSLAQNKRNIIMPFLLLLLSISIYQAFVAVFLVAVTIYLLTNLMRKMDNPEDNSLDRKFVYNSSATLVLALVVFFIINKIVGFFVPASNYTDSFVAWGKIPFLSVIKGIIKSLKGIYFNMSIQNTIFLYTFLLLIVISVVLYFMTKSVILKSKFLIVLLILFFSPFSLCFALGTILPYRALIGLPLQIGFVWFLGALVFEKYINLRRLYRIFSILILIIQIQTINQIFVGDNFRYKMDINTGNELASGILQYSNGNINKPVVFIGSYERKEERVIRFDTIGASFFEWDDGNNWRINSFLRTLGYNFQAPSKEQVKEVVNEVKITNMGSWPQKNSIIALQNFIVVKLSNPSALWYQVNTQN